MRELLTSLRLRLKTLLRKKQLEQDLADELAFHLAKRQEKLDVEGESEPDFAARRRFGNVTRITEDCREAWSVTSIERLWADVRIGLRLIRKNRWTVLAVVLSLSLGIGTVAAVFNLFDFFVFRSYPVPDTGRVVRIMANSQGSEMQYLISNK